MERALRHAGRIVVRGAITIAGLAVFAAPFVVAVFAARAIGRAGEALGWAPLWVLALMWLAWPVLTVLACRVWFGALLRLSAAGLNWMVRRCERAAPGEAPETDAEPTPGRGPSLAGAP